MEWKITPGLVEYEEALEHMAARVTAIQRGEADELVWLLEHPPLYTAGSSAQLQDLLDHHGFPVYATGRGGQYTYHGPGQRVVYLMLDLNRRGRDLRAYVQQLETWIIGTLNEFGIEGFIREGRVGVWVQERVARDAWRVAGEKTARHPSPVTHHREAKIAAIGVRVQKWVTSHGIALNVSPDLSHYAGIVPCGIREYGVTSLHALDVAATMENVDIALKRQWHKVFG